jgi:hypothetical protein
MKSLLDDFYTSFLHATLYADRELRVIVAEGFRAAEPEDITILGHVLKGSYALNTSAESRLVEVRFTNPVAWQTVKEQFTVRDDYEVRDDNSTFLQVLTRSRYLDYVRANHGWFEDIFGPGKLYRICTEDDIVEVVACDPPTVQPATDT